VDQGSYQVLFVYPEGTREGTFPSLFLEVIMRWKSPPENVQFILALPILVITSPFWVAATLIMFSIVQYEKYFGLKSEWVKWFAWRPVRFNSWDWDGDEWYGKWVWLETVERHKENDVVEYRPKKVEDNG
jgi:hypothetical protein